MNTIQSKILEIYKEVAGICERHDIRYYAIGGTCLGAVRHKGFIPWDDDMDIAMPENDFLRFLEIVAEELPEHLEVYHPEYLRHREIFFVKVLDNRTTLIENTCMNHPENYGGVWLDIMPLGGVPKPGVNRTWYLLRSRWLHRLSMLLRRDIEHMPLYYKIVALLLYPLRSVVSPAFFWNSHIRLMKKYPFDTSPYIGYTWSYQLKRLIFPQEWYRDYVVMPFEDTTIRCPKHWHEFLTLMFGDYMRFPPEDKRNSGHEFDKGIVDLERPYKYYQNLFKQ